ncbi:MAG: hypothetical protein DSM106950_00480 [Stigonema ocellatum SAG 48.90 = DSM 106950]|nr:hypothetical protein [Stigonema ocellatum SAG 48.90 = DSM 106950]
MNLQQHLRRPTERESEEFAHGQSESRSGKCNTIPQCLARLCPKLITRLSLSGKNSSFLAGAPTHGGLVFFWISLIGFYLLFLRWVGKGLGVIDTRLKPQICKKLDLISREDWKQTVSAWFEMAKQRVSKETSEIAQAHNLRRRDRIQAEFILAKEKHELKRGDWEKIKEDEGEKEDEEVQK